MKKKHVYIDGERIPEENIVSVEVTETKILIELIYPDKKERIKTDSAVRNIELKDN